MTLNFGQKRRFIRAFYASSDRMNSALIWFFVDVLGYHPQRHSFAWFVANWFFVDCIVCFFWRAWGLGVAFGCVLALIVARWLL